MKINEYGLINLQYIDKEITYLESEVKRFYNSQKFELAQYTNGKLTMLREIKQQLLDTMPLCEDVFHAGVQYGAEKEDYSGDSPNMITFLNSDIPFTPKAIITKSY